MDNIILLWLVAAVVAALVELITPGFVFGLAGTAGALAGACAAWYGMNGQAQSALFVGVTLIGIIFSRWWIARVQEARILPTNTAALIGKHALVMKPIQGRIESGLVKIRGETWTAYGLHEGVIHEGVMVEIVAVQGCHLVVKELTSL